MAPAKSFSRAAIAASLGFLAIAATASADAIAPIQLKVISWNLHGVPFVTKDKPGRFERARKKIAELKPDLVFLQEVWVGTDSDRLAHLLAPELDPIFLLTPSNRPAGGLVIFVRSGRWHTEGVPEFQEFGASGPIWKFWEGDGLGGKGFLTIYINDGTHRIRLIDTHVQSQYPREEYEQVRASQLADLRAAIDKTGPDVPILLAGDFNTTPAERLYTAITSLGVDLTATFRQTHEGGTALNDDDTSDWVDYIIAAHCDPARTKSELKLITNKTVDDPYSDHQGLNATVSLMPASASAGPAER